MEEPARPVGLRDHCGCFKLSLFYQNLITEPSEAVVLTMDLGEGVKYRVGSVSYNVLADGTHFLSSISNFEEATCEVQQGLRHALRPRSAKQEAVFRPRVLW